MQKLKKLPFILAIIVASITAACSDIDVTPRTEDEDPAITIPPPTKSNTTSTDTVSIG